MLGSLCHVLSGLGPRMKSTQKQLWQPSAVPGQEWPRTGSTTARPCRLKGEVSAVGLGISVLMKE